MNTSQRQTHNSTALICDRALQNQEISSQLGANWIIMQSVQKCAYKACVKSPVNLWTEGGETRVLFKALNVNYMDP